MHIFAAVGLQIRRNVLLVRTSRRAGNCTLKRSDVLAVLSELEDALCNYLKDGKIVRLNHLGRLKLEIEGKPVSRPEEFDPQKHIRAVRLHFIPESRNGRQPLYEGIKFKKKA